MFYKKSENGALELWEGYDYDLQVWVREGRILEEPGLNGATYEGMMWRDARALAFDEAQHKTLWTRWLVAEHGVDG